jgi:hypothetical protein
MKQEAPKRVIQSWDFGFAFGRKNGDVAAAAPAWKAYAGEVIPLQKGDVLWVNAMRIGYMPSVIEYADGKTIVDDEVK